MPIAAKSSRPRILNSEPLGYSESAREILRELGDLEERELGRDGLMREIGNTDILLVRLANTLDREMLDQSERLSVIVSPTTGLDHIDLDYASERGITVLSLRGEHDFLSSVTSTAEHTWALLLALVRRLPFAFDHVRGGGWDRDMFRGEELQGKTIGLVGLGRIGIIVAEYARAFRMEVLAYDPAPRSWPGEVGRVESLDDLAGSVDILSVHAPLDETTIGLVSREVMATMRQGSILINTARSEIVDNRALLDSLLSGHLTGAALDVVPAERSEDDRAASGLIDYAATHDNLIITPHIGGATLQAMERTEIFMAEKLRHHLLREDERS